MKRRLLRIAAGAGAAYLVLVAILSVPLVSVLLIDRLQIFPALTNTQIETAAQDPATAIVILAAGRRNFAPEFGGATIDELTLERVRYGADLARRTGLPVLVSGGLDTPDSPPLAKLMADALMRDYGVKAKWQESLSRNTAENAIYSSAMLKKAGIARVLLVTHAWHEKRARQSFVANGMTVLPAPTAFYGRIRAYTPPVFMPTARALRMSGFALHETVGSVWYSIRYGY